jgi:hypothetical protein
MVVMNKISRKSAAAQEGKAAATGQQGMARKMPRRQARRGMPCNGQE